MLLPLPVLAAFYDTYISDWEHFPHTQQAKLAFIITYLATCMVKYN